MLQPMADTERPDTSELTAFIHEQMPLCALLGVEALEMDPGGVRPLRGAPTCARRAGCCTAERWIALADSAGAACAFGNSPEGATGTSTIESKTNFLGAVRQGRVVATASAAARRVDDHRGRDRGADDVDRPVSKITQTQIVLRRGA